MTRWIGASIVKGRIALRGDARGDGRVNTVIHCLSSPYASVCNILGGSSCVAWWCRDTWWKDCLIVDGFWIDGHLIGLIVNGGGESPK
jgi:hypothetical protein